MLDFNPQVEALEVRAVPASQGIAPGTYHEPFPENPPGDELIVFPDGSAQFSTPGIGRFPVTIHAKPNGKVIIKPHSKGVHGKIELTPSDLAGYHYKYKIRADGEKSSNSGDLLLN